MPQWNNSNRRQRLPVDWERRRKRILKRDNWQCRHICDDGTRCPELATEVDHIRPGDDHREPNLRALCEWHHRQKSSREGSEARRALLAKMKAKYASTEKHPAQIAMEVKRGTARTDTEAV